MKKLTLLICILFLISCGTNVPKIGDPEDPFIVFKVIKHNEKFSNYSAYKQESYSSTFIIDDNFHTMILPIGLYTVGDTIKINLFK